MMCTFCLMCRGFENFAPRFPVYFLEPHTSPQRSVPALVASACWIARGSCTSEDGKRYYSDATRIGTDSLLASKRTGFEEVFDDAGTKLVSISQRKGAISDEFRKDEKNQESVK